MFYVYILYMINKSKKSLPKSFSYLCLLLDPRVDPHMPHLYYSFFLIPSVLLNLIPFLKGLCYLEFLCDLGRSFCFWFCLTYKLNDI